MSTISVKRTAVIFAAFVTAAFSAKAQSTVTIGTGTSNSTSQPIYTFNNYSATESIYRSSEFGGQTGYITAIAYDKASGASTQTIPNVTIYMKLVADTTTGSTNRSISLSSYTQVWNGTFPNSASGWQEVILDAPFAYTGSTQNISVLVVNNSGTVISSGRPSYRYTTISGAKRNANYSNDAASWNDSKTLTSVWERPNARFTFQPSSPLAILLNSFKATAQPHANLITWSTATETKGNVYILEKQTGNEGAFTAVYETTALTSGTTGATYSYTEKNSTTGLSLYRLRMRDEQGDETFSKTIAVNNNTLQTNGFTIYPNPATETITLVLAQPATSNSAIVIRSMNGEIVKTARAENKNEITLSIASLPAGAYAITYGGLTKTMIKR